MLRYLIAGFRRETGCKFLEFRVILQIEMLTFEVCLITC